MERKDIDNLEIFQISMHIGQLSYELAHKWEVLQKNTIGYQLIRAADSISANISEGYGRFHFKEQRQFCYIARGSLYETNTWLTKTKVRIPEDTDKIDELIMLSHLLLKRLNAYINYIEKRIK
jgi:four helix bundle protein